MPTLYADLSNLLSQLEEFEAESVSPLYPPISAKLKKAYLEDGLNGLNAVYRSALTELAEKQIEIIEKVIELAAQRAGQNYARKIETVPENTDEESAFDLFVLGLLVSPSTKLLEEIIPNAVAKEILTNPDHWGLRPQERVWRNTSDTLAELHKALAVHLRKKQKAQDGINKLRNYVYDDKGLPRHIQEVERSARAALAGDLRSKNIFLRRVREARELVKQRRGGPAGSRMFQEETLKRFEDAVNRGSLISVNSSIDYFIESRHRLRGLTLLQSLANDAYQQTNLHIFRADPAVLAVKWNLSPGHIHFDRCDILARADLGLGPGVYFKHNIPWRPHANCACSLSDVRATESGQEPFMPQFESDYAEAIRYIEGDAAKEADRRGYLKTITESERAERKQKLFKSIPKVGKK